MLKKTAILLLIFVISTIIIQISGQSLNETQIKIRIRNLPPSSSYTFNYIFVNIPPCRVKATYQVKTTDGIFRYEGLPVINLSNISKKVAVFDKPVYKIREAVYRGYHVLVLAIPRFFSRDHYVYHTENINLTLTFNNCRYYTVSYADPFLSKITVNEPIYREPFLDGPKVMVIAKSLDYSFHWDGMKIVVPDGTSLASLTHEGRIPENARLLLIVGNASMIKPYYLNFTVIHENYTVATDWPVAVSGGIPQFPVVRIPVNSLAELNEVLRKDVRYNLSGKWDFIGAEPWVQTNLPKKIASDLRELGYLKRAYLQVARVEGSERVFMENISKIKPGVLGQRVLILMHGRENRTVLLRFHSGNGSEYFTVNPINASQWVSLLSNTKEVFLLSCLAGSYDKANSLIERIFLETPATTVVGFSRPALVSIRERPIAGGSYAATLAVWHVKYGGGVEGAFRSILAYSMKAMTDDEKYTWYETVLTSITPILGRG